MPIDAQRAWLTAETYDRARIELALLRMEPAMGAHREHSDPDQRALRIRQLQELIATAAVGHEPPDDGVAEPGMVLTVRYEADDLTETFLMADLEESTPPRPPGLLIPRTAGHGTVRGKGGGTTCICSPEAKR
jgi:transcription elongation factor GreA